MIIFKTLEWGNCFSYGPSNKINLDQHNITQIVGSNGAGKSSIPTIIEEALFNKNSRGIKKSAIPNREINDGYWIEITWDKNGDTYKLVVNRKTSIKVTLFRNDEDISSHTATNTYKTVEQILGMDFKTFPQIVYQSTTSGLQFLTATDANRKKFLIDLLRLDEYLQKFELFKKRAKEVSLEVTKTETKLESIQKWLDDNILEDTTILPMLKLPKISEDDEKELSHLTSEIKNISEKNKKIIQNNQYKQLLQSINLNELNSIKATVNMPYDNLQTELGACRSKVTTSKALVNKIEGLHGVCHTCGQDISEDHKTEMLAAEVDIILENEEKIKQIEEEINERKRNNSELLRKNKMQRDWEELYHSIDHSLPETLLDKRELERSVADIRTRILRARESVEKTARTNEERARRNTRIQVILEQTEEFKKQLTSLQDSLKGLKDTLANLEILKKAFSPNGLLAYKIENSVKELEELTNTYLSDLSDGRFTIEFTVSSDKLNVIITDNGKEIEITSLSSGELAKVTTATLLAIRALMSSISESKLNLLFLDEIINVLDEQAREKLIEILVDEKELNTFIVSHGWTHPLLAKIEVVKENDISRLD